MLSLSNLFLFLLDFALELLVGGIGDWDGKALIPLNVAEHSGDVRTHRRCHLASLGVIIETSQTESFNVIRLLWSRRSDLR